MASVPGTEGNDPQLTGTEVNDDIDGNGGNDVLFGFGGDDELFGGEGNDVLIGAEGDDILRGQNGADDLRGGENDDDLYALGEGQGLLDIAQDSISEDLEAISPAGPDGEPTTPIPRSEISGPDTLTGGSGDDLFYIQRGAEGEGFGFFAGQQYALITDFSNEPGNDDVIRLPGSDENYTTRGIDLNGDGNNESTAIFYTENPNIEVGVDILPVPIISTSGSRTVDVAADDALIAVVENAAVRGLTDDNFYTYT